MSIRVRTEYSFRKAVGKIEDVLDRIDDIGLPAAPMTDTASAFGWRQWQELCLSRGIEPVFGVELAVAEKPGAKKGASHWTFIAQNSLEPLNELIYLAGQKFHYEPKLTYEEAQSIEGVFKVVGHRSKLDLVSPSDDLAVALAPSIVPSYFKIASEKGFQFVMASDNRFPTEGDRQLYEVIAGMGARLQTYPQWILSDEEWFDVMADHKDQAGLDDGVLTDAMILRNKWLEKASGVRMRKGKLLSPKRPNTLRTLCLQGADRLSLDIGSKLYSDRLDRELEIIAAKGFEDYFYIISDLVQWARERMEVGPARGSAAGSLVCYLLGITTVDPIENDLLFERFIDINRGDLPDIDIDFQDNKREKAFAYMAQKYGIEHVARLGSVAMYQPRSAIKETAGALVIPPWEVEPVINSFTDGKDVVKNTLLLSEAGGRLRKKAPGIMIAADMEGHARHFSQHAAGILVTDEPVRKYVAVDVSSNKNEETSEYGITHCDKRDAEALDLLKIDALGLKQLSIFADVRDMVGKGADIIFDSKRPLNREKAFDVFREHRYTGIFQFEGGAVQGVANQIRIEDFEDLVAITSLARPGPMNSGETQRWIDRKNGNAEVRYPHPLFEPILDKTLGVITYQEQIMRIAREVAGMSWEDVTLLRKAVSKSAGVEAMRQFAEKFIPGAVANGVPADVAENVFDKICESGAYLFNRSHAVAYSIISYQCAWLKAAYPVEFAASTLSHTDNDDSQLKMLREIVSNEEIEYRPVDPDHSEVDRWTVYENTLIGPLTAVNGIGLKLATDIASKRAAGVELPKRAQSLLDTPFTSVDDLEPIKAFIEKQGGLSSFNIVSEPVPIGKITGTEGHMILVVGKVKRLTEIDEEKRTGKPVNGPKHAINLWIADDTGEEIFAKVNRYEYEKLSKVILESKPDKTVLALKCESWASRSGDGFRGLSVKMARIIGHMEKETVRGERLTQDVINKPNDSGTLYVSEICNRGECNVDLRLHNNSIEVKTNTQTRSLFSPKVRQQYSIDCERLEVLVKSELGQTETLSKELLEAVRQKCFDNKILIERVHDQNAA